MLLALSIMGCLNLIQLVTEVQLAVYAPACITQQQLQAQYKFKETAQA